jgi:quinol monooxygenase YgiN
MENLVKKFKDVGECEVDIEKILQKWDKSFFISQWKDEYTLAHHNRNSDHFSRTDLKVRISKIQADEIIIKLNLTPHQSEVFRSGVTWRHP